MAGEVWLSGAQWGAIEPLLPPRRPGVQPWDNWQVISGIGRMPKHGGRWQDVPDCFGPPTTTYSRYHRWSQQGVWSGMPAAVADATPGGLQRTDSTTARAHRCA